VAKLFPKHKPSPIPHARGRGDNRAMKATVLLVLVIFSVFTAAVTAAFYTSNGYVPLSITELISFII
jgi:hypothetical protein